MPDNNTKWIASLWRRFGAFFIDSLLLGVAGFILGWFFGGTFAQLDGWGRLVGFGIALVYFGVMDSSICNGQSIGKKALKVRVVDTDSETMAPWRSMLRYMVLAIPFALNGAHFSYQSIHSLLIYPLSVVIFGGILSILYLFVFNRVTRQSLHDLAVGSYVVNADAENQKVGAVWRVHLIIVALLFVITAILPAFTGKLAQSGLFKGLLAAQSALSREPGISYCTINSGTTTSISSNSGSRHTTYVGVKAFLSADNINDRKLARHLADIVLQTFPDAGKKDAVEITLIHGYDIGIWSRWYSHTYDFNPAELRGEQSSQSGRYGNQNRQRDAQ